MSGNLGPSRPIVTRKEAKSRGLKQYFTGKPCKREHVAYRMTYNGYCTKCQGEARREGRPPRSLARGEAISAGLARYFTGRPCRRGHIAERRVAGKGCVECLKITSTALVAAHPERQTVYKARFKVKNPGKLMEYSRANEARPERKEYRRLRESSPKGILKGRMSIAINRALRTGKRGASWTSLAGYSVDDLRRHIERQFTKGMSWDRISEIHIDHIVPLSSFNYTSPDDPEFKAAWALTNLRPLWAKQNLSKGAKRTVLL